MNADTIAAIATAPGRGAVAIVRLSGPDSWRIASALTARALVPEDAGRFFHVRIRRDIDDGLMLVSKAPRSYTGEDTIEFQGHGGTVLPRRILEAALAAGARLANRGEFTLRAFLNGKLDLGKAEAVIDLVDARNQRAASEAFARYSGVLSNRFEALYAQALGLSSRLEYALDVDESDLPPDFESNIRHAVATLDAQILNLLATAREGALLRSGALVVLAGAPNAGKSSLLNALVGNNRAIVSDVAGTTRDSIEVEAEIGGWPVRLVDTAGLRDTDDPIEAEGVQRAHALMAQADLVIALDCAIPGALCIHAKCDLDGLPGVSAKTGAGLEALKSEIAARLAARANRGNEESGADITTRQKTLLEAAHAALTQDLPFDCALQAEALRNAAENIGRITGKVYSADILDALFSRFCVGK